MKTYRHISLPSLCHSCVWNWTYLTSFTEGPKGITITKFVCTWFCVRVTAVAGIPDFPLFSAFYPSRLFQTRGLHRPQPTRGVTEKWSRAESTNFQTPAVNKQAHVVCGNVTDGFCSVVGSFFFFLNFLSAGCSTPESPTHVGLWVKSVMNHTKAWLSFINDTLGTFFFDRLKMKLEKRPCGLGRGNKQRNTARQMSKSHWGFCVKAAVPECTIASWI